MVINLLYRFLLTMPLEVAKNARTWEMKWSSYTVVTSITALARRWAVTSAGVHPKNTWGALDGDVKLPGVCLANETLGPREDQLGAELGSFVELMCKTHDT